MTLRTRLFAIGVMIALLGASGLIAVGAMAYMAAQFPARLAQSQQQLDLMRELRADLHILELQVADEPYEASTVASLQANLRELEAATESEREGDQGEHDHLSDLHRIAISIEQSPGDRQALDELHGVLEDWIEQEEAEVAQTRLALEENLRMSLLYTSLTGGVLVALCLAGLVWMLTSIRRRIEALQLGIRRLATGDLGSRMHNSHKDELGEVADGLDRMAEQLEEMTVSRDDLVITAKLARSASQAKSTFVGTMSHELRTPMHAVLGMTELLRDTPLDETQHGYLDIIDASGQALIDMVNDVLDFSKLEAGRLEINRRACAVRELLGAYIAGPRIQAQQRGLTLTLRVDDAIPAYLHVDPVRLNQILSNLVTNAIHHTPTGGISVDLVLADQQASGAHTLRLEVRDTGVGIGAEEQDKILQPFVQASNNKTAAGTGLGLSIVVELARLMGGQLEVSSAVGHGSTFSVTLVADEAEAPKESNRPAPKRTEGPLRVLIVDDHPVNRLLLRRMLEGTGHDVDEAADGHEAVNAVRRQVYDAILMDISMPGMDGYEATLRIRSDTQVKHNVPILAVTAHALDRDRWFGDAATLDGWLCKPLSRESLDATLASLPEPVVLLRRDQPFEHQTSVWVREGFVHLAATIRAEGDVHTWRAASTHLARGLLAKGDPGRDALATLELLLGFEQHGNPALLEAVLDDLAGQIRDITRRPRRTG